MALTVTAVKASKLRQFRLEKFFLVDQPVMFPFINQGAYLFVRSTDNEDTFDNTTGALLTTELTALSTAVDG